MLLRRRMIRRGEIFVDAVILAVAFGLAFLARLEGVLAYSLAMVLCVLGLVGARAFARCLRPNGECGPGPKPVSTLHKFTGGRFNPSTPQPVPIDDLLRRSPVRLECREVDGIIRDQIVLVTGA